MGCPHGSIPGAGDASAALDATTDNVGYLGHEVWAGPQKDWWTEGRQPGARVYVPVAASADVTLNKDAGGPGGSAPAYTLADGVFSLDLPAGPRKGKVLIQPAAGWMAGFRGGQAFIVQFALQARGAIHPDQGQVELYHDFQPGKPDQGLLEMEVHAPCVRLAPGRRMEASGLWTILPYAGPDMRTAHLAFLRAQARALGLAGLAPAAAR
jgi:hypothetical protein